MPGRIQNEDIKSVSELAALGCGPEKLPNDDKIFVTANGINKTLKEAIEDGEIGAGGGGGGTFSEDDILTSLDGEVLVNSAGNVLLTGAPTVAPPSPSSIPELESENGSVTMKLKPEVFEWILQSPNNTLWGVTVDDDGVLTATDGATGDVTGLQVTRPDSTVVSIGITDLGELQVSNPAGAGDLNDEFFLESPDGTAWRVGVNDDDEIFTENDSSAANYFRVVNDKNQVIFQVQEQNGGALVYKSVYTAATLPGTPPALSGVLPVAFYDTGSAKKPIYHDGTIWRYMSDDSAV